MKKQDLTIPNCITLLRIAGTVGLLFARPLSTAFFVLYTLTGLTDVLDGWCARRLGQCSASGAALDSIADLLFYGVMLIRLVPILYGCLPRQIWYAVGAAAAVRVAAYATAAVKYRRFAALHTRMNKLSGGAVFAVPFLFSLPWGEIYCWAVCAVAILAAVEELLIHLRRSEYTNGSPGST